MPPKETIGDSNFNKALNELKDFHKEFPTLRLGSVIQMIVDTKKKRINFNLNDISTKEFLKSAKEFKQMMKDKSVKKPKKEVI